VWKRILVVGLLLSLFSFCLTPLRAADEGVFSLKGQIQGLRNTAVQYMALRSDGRYLFYSTGDSSWNVIDLLDMVTTGTAVSVDGSVVQLSLDGDQRLIVVTTAGIQYFDVTKSLSPEEEDNKFETPTSATTTVVGACVDSNQQVYFLEQSETKYEHLLRTVKGTTEQSETDWINIFGNTGKDLVPYAIRCAKNNVIVAAEDADSTTIDLYLSRLSPSDLSQSQETIELSNDYEDYSTQDFGLSADGEQFLLMLNALEDGSKENSEYTKVLSFSSSSLNSSFVVNMGAEGMAMARYFQSDASAYSFFMGKNYFDDPLQTDVDELLNVVASSFSPLINADRWGDKGDAIFGDSSVGSTSYSSWVNSSKDHYVYGITESSGVSLLTKGASLNFESDPGTPALSASSPLEFNLVSDRDLTYEIRFDESPNADGTSNGLDYSAGKKIQEGDLQKNVAKSISLSASDLGITKDGTHSLMIFGRYKGASIDDPVSRLGLSFTYNPPPDAIRNFHLAVGDESVHVYFDPASDPGDIAHYLIYLGYTKSDLSDLPTSDAELDTWTRSITGVDGKSISSPVSLSPSSFSGSYVIAPLENNKELYVRVQVVDSSSQYSTGNPAALGATPVKTKSLADAFGSENSCSFVAKSKGLDSSFFSFMSLFALMALAIFF